MNLDALRRRIATENGQNLVEFALSGFLLVMLLLGIVEIGRLVLVYTTVANAARAGARYAIVHGSDALASASDVQNVVTSFLGAVPMNTAASGLSINVTCSTDGTTFAACTTTNAHPGNFVSVSVSYPYDPLVGYFPWGTINLASTTQEVITF